MPLLTPDTSQAEDFSKPINPGTYPARVIAAEVGKSKAGNDKFMPKFKIMVDGNERTRQAHLVVTGEGASGFDQFLRAVGLTPLADQYRDKTVQPKPPFDTDATIGANLMVVIGPNLYKNPATGKDEMRDQIDGFLPA